MTEAFSCQSLLPHDITQRPPVPAASSRRGSRSTRSHRVTPPRRAARPRRRCRPGLLRRRRWSVVPAMAAAARGGSSAPRPSLAVSPSSSNPSKRVCHQLRQTGSVEVEAVDQAWTTTSDSCREDVSVSNASEVEVTEWVIQDEPGLYITVRKLCRLRFSREKFAELNAKLWCEENKERIYAQYF